MPNVRHVVDAFLKTVEAEPDGVALRWRSGEAADGSWTYDSWTWTEYLDRAARIAGALRERGLQPGERVALFMRNRREFHIMDMGVLLAGGTPVSVYLSSSPEQFAYVASHCHAVAVFVEAGGPLERVEKARADLPELRDLVVVGAADGDPLPAGAVVLEDLLTSAPVDAAAASEAIDPRDLLTVIYTSGTTGPPKGVMIDHVNALAQYVGLEHFLTQFRDNEIKLRMVSYLPMAHVAERVISHWNHVFWGGEVIPCPEPVQLGPYLVQVRPNVLFGPPRIWEKLTAGIQAAVGAAGPEAEAKFDGARQVGHQVADLRAAGQPLPPELQAMWDAVDAAAFRPLRARVGLDECEVAFSGAAPIPPEVVQFLRDIGVPMSEVYGMSENTGGMTWDPYAVRTGYAGRALPGVEVRLGDDGEVLCRGDLVFSGYLEDPEKTAETLDADGWLHTGDIGEMDADGYLRIVDRKKELIITAGGKNISPANIEAALKTVPLVGQAAVFGDNRPYLVAVLVLDPEIAGPKGLSADDPAVAEQVAAAVAVANGRFSRVEQVKRFVLIDDEWLPDSDVLTPTMKLKRRGVRDRYGDTVAGMYDGGGIAVPALG